FLKVWASNLRLQIVTLISTFVTVLLAYGAAYAIPIKEIKITGQKKIEATAIQTKISSKVGKEYSADQVRQDVRALFAMGYFNDVIVTREKVANGYVLTFTVQEKPKVS